MTHRRPGICAVEIPPDILPGINQEFPLISYANGPTFVYRHEHGDRSQPILQTTVIHQWRSQGRAGEAAGGWGSAPNPAAGFRLQTPS